MVSKFSDIVVLVPGIVSAMPIGNGSVRAMHRVARRASPRLAAEHDRGAGQGVRHEMRPPLDIDQVFARDESIRSDVKPGSEGVALDAVSAPAPETAPSSQGSNQVVQRRVNVR